MTNHVQTDGKAEALLRTHRIAEQRHGRASPGSAGGLLICAWLMICPVAAEAQQDSLVLVRNDSVTIRLIDADLRLALQAIGRYLDRPIVFGTMADHRVTLETPQPVPTSELAALIAGMLKIYGLELDDETTFYTVRASQGQLPEVTDGIMHPVQLFVIRLRHARASDVAATVNALYGRSGALGEIGTQRRTLAESLRQDLVPPTQAGAEPGPGPITQQVAELSGDITIIPDARTNTLLVRAARADFDLIDAAVQQLDVRPLQVLIEVVIAEVRRDRSLGVGIDASLPARRIRGTTDTEMDGATTGLGLGDFVLNVMKLGGSDLNVTLRAAASRGDASILSRPVLLTANNEAAEILVGSQRPFVQVQRALPTDAPIRDQVVQFKDVGTRLMVIPTVSDDGYVMLEVLQEVNAATAEVAFDAPVISTRTIKTQLLVRDGHTAVLGGLADQQRDFTRSGIPYLMDIPVLGALFGKRVARTSDTELFVFLTPRVLRTDEDLDDASRDAGDRTRELTKRILPPLPTAIPPDTIQNMR
jgi:general secretion pathway protein D